MAGPTLIPKIRLEEISQGSERAVAKALVETLDSGWTLFHSYSWLRSHPGAKKMHLREGEADFVLLHRKFGLLVLEVKGGQVAFDSETGVWHQNHHLMKDPFKQAQNNLHALLEQIGERARFLKPGAKGIPCTFGYAVAFPACDFHGALPPGGHPAIVFGARDLSQLGACVEKALKHWSTGFASGPMEPGDFKALKQALTSNFRTVVSLSASLDSDEETLLRLTEDQTEQWIGLLETPRAAVEGVAGSGKTLLALKRAEEFASVGRRVLFLCYNKKLAESVERRVGAIPGLKVANFHRLCHDLCLEAGVEFDIPLSPEGANVFWRETAPELLLDALELLPGTRFDALVVDEAQDFLDLWWISVEKFLSEPNGSMYLFYDRDQNVYGADLEFPITAPLFKLKTNCRNTKSIAAGCSSVLGSTIRTSSFAPIGDRLDIVVTSSPEEILTRCEGLLREFVGTQGISKSRIAILSTRSRAKSQLGEGPVGDYQLTDDLQDWESGLAVWFSTVKAFKGLESDILILIEAGDFHPVFFSRQDLYVALSRAKHRFVVLTSSSEVAEALKSPVAAKDAKLPS